MTTDYNSMRIRTYDNIRTIIVWESVLMATDYNSMRINTYGNRL